MTIKQQGGIFGRNPTFNNLDVDGTTDLNSVNATSITATGLTVNAVQNTLLEADQSGTVRNLQISNADVAVNNRAGLYFQPSNSIATSYIDGVAEDDASTTAKRDGSIVFGTRLDGSFADQVKITSQGNIAILNSGNGIDFSATSGTGTSELFDDYEEGTWTPAIEIYGTPGTYTATTSGIYTKVGNLVTVTGRLINVTESVAGGADYFKITGLPFTDIAGYSAVGSVSLGNWNVPACYNAFVTFDSTGARDYVIMGLNVDNGATDYLDKTHLVSGTSDIEFTISYFT